MYFQYHPWAVAFTCILTISFLLRLVVVDTAGSGTPGTEEHGSWLSSCDRRGWKWAQLYGPCWNSLIKLQASTTWMDITLPTGYTLMLLCSVALVLYRCTKLSKKYPMEWIYLAIIVIITIVMIVIIFLKCIFFSQLYMTCARPEQAKSISGQLHKSLMKYGHDEDITRAWQNTMREGCCCGLHGYQDFNNIGVDVPLQCDCFYKEEQPYLYKGCTQIYNSDSYNHSQCTAPHFTKLTNVGCFSFVVDKVDDATYYVKVVQILIVFFSSVSILVIAMPMGFMLHDAYSANRQIPQMEHKKKSVYMFKGSLSKKLVRIFLNSNNCVSVINLLQYVLHNML